MLQSNTQLYLKLEYTLFKKICFLSAENVFISNIPTISRKYPITSFKFVGPILLIHKPI